MPYTILGKPATLSTEPFLQNDKHYVSLREVVGALGGTTTWDNTNKVATATVAPWTATVKMDDTNVTMTGGPNSQSVPVTLTAPPYVENDDLYVPYDFFRDAFGYQVDMDNDTLTISLPGQG